ncbi:hypothetical protein E6H25_06020 [Candidatus Bathyarchaeota archaeon]|nr:MAG: hypothetical protein E6H25_06020 [Candidatus Bathyarchaeota archaeon]
MNERVVAYQLGIFVTQWALMILGFGILTRIVAPLRLVALNLPFGSYFDASVKVVASSGSAALCRED